MHRHTKLAGAAGTWDCHCVAGRGSEMPSTLCSFSDGAISRVAISHQANTENWLVELQGHVALRFQSSANKLDLQSWMPWAPWSP